MESPQGELSAEGRSESIDPAAVAREAERHEEGERRGEEEARGIHD
jgi:hypothetical protein